VQHGQNSVNLCELMPPGVFSLVAQRYHQIHGAKVQMAAIPERGSGRLLKDAREGGLRLRVGDTWADAGDAKPPSFRVVETAITAGCALKINPSKFGGATPCALWSALGGAMSLKHYRRFSHPSSRRTCSASQSRPRLAARPTRPKMHRSMHEARCPHSAHDQY
jgi:hypothetical protein